MHSNNREVVHSNNREVVYSNSREVMNSNSREVMNSNSREVMNSNSRVVVHSNNREVVNSRLVQYQEVLKTASKFVYDNRSAHTRMKKSCLCCFDYSLPSNDSKLINFFAIIIIHNVYGS